jgi:hypothetical protein
MNISTKKSLYLMALLSSAPMFGMLDKMRSQVSQNTNQSPTNQGSNEIIIVRPQEQNADAATQKMIARALAAHPSFTEPQIRDLLAAGKQSMEQYLESVKSGRVTFGQNLPPFTAVMGNDIKFELKNALIAAANK